jgi:subtilisin family serine protease
MIFLLLMGRTITFAQDNTSLIPTQIPNNREIKEMVVIFKKKASVTSILSLTQNSQIEPKYGIAEVNSMVFSLKDSNLKEEIQKTRQNQNVAAVFPNYRFHKLVIPNDTFLIATPVPGRARLQWNMFNLKLADSGKSAWDVTTGSSSIVVAVIDTGIDSSHPDLNGKIASLVDCVTTCKEVNSMTDDSLEPHGTHVSGLVAAATNNNLGIAGSGYNTKIMMIKVMGEDGSITLSSVVNGIRWAVDHGAKVVNLSLGAIEENMDSDAIKSLNEAITNDQHTGAWDKGLVVFASAGNCGSNTDGDAACAILDANGNVTGYATNPKVYPAASPNVIAVAALDIDNKLTAYSEHNDSTNGKIGEWIHIAAPGGDCSSNDNADKCILSTIYSSSSGKYGYMAGTSQASPQVAGIAALLFAVNPNLKNEDVRRIIFETANQNVAKGSKATKYGLVDALAAVMRASSGITPSPTTYSTATPTPTGAISTPSPTPTRTLSPTPTPPNISPSVTPYPTTPPRLPKTPPSPYPSPPYCPNFSSSSCQDKIKGDADCDGVINDLDYNWWQKEYDYMISPEPLNQNANFFCQEGKSDTYWVDMVDFEKWRRYTSSFTSPSLIPGSPTPASPTSVTGNPPQPSNTPSCHQECTPTGETYYWKHCYCYRTEGKSNQYRGDVISCRSEECVNNRNEFPDGWCETDDCWGEPVQSCRTVCP